MSQQINMRTKNGFTLIELMLAMTFISILLLAIAMTIVQIATIYNKGTLTKDLNQTSREISDELTTAIGSSGTFSTDAGSNSYVTKSWGGRLCVGKASYVWNYAKAISTSSLDPNRNAFTAGSVVTTLNTINIGSGLQNEISFVKVTDAGGSYCTPKADGSYPTIDRTKATELLRTGDHSFALHSLTVKAVSADAVSAQNLYTVTFSLGTSDLKALTGSGADTTCLAPGATGADPNYCSVQKFTLVLRVANGVN